MGQGTCQEVRPHTRGWTEDVRAEIIRDIGKPAHAGVDRSLLTYLEWRRQNRTRGVDPQTPQGQLGLERVNPHKRGWTPSESVP